MPLVVDEHGRGFLGACGDELIYGHARPARSRHLLRHDDLSSRVDRRELRRVKVLCSGAHRSRHHHRREEASSAFMHTEYYTVVDIGTCRAILKM